MSDIVSTLWEMHTALEIHWRSVLRACDSSLFNNDAQVVLAPSPTGIDSDFFRFEEVLNLKNKGNTERVTAILPSLAFSLSGISDIWKKWKHREEVVIKPTNSSGDIARANPISLSIEVRMYCNDYNELMRVFEIWIMAIMDIHKFEYISQVLPDQIFSLNLEYDLPTLRIIPSSSDRYRVKGQIYSFTTNVTVDGIIVLFDNPIRKATRINKTFFTLYDIGKLQDTIIDRERTYGDQGVDQLKVIDTGEQSSND